jgi:hypothetical protein
MMPYLKKVFFFFLWLSPFLFFFVFLGDINEVLISVNGQVSEATAKGKLAIIKTAIYRFAEGVHVTTPIVLGHERLRTDADDARVYSKLVAVRTCVLTVTVGCAVHQKGATCSLLLVEACLVARAPEDVVIDVITEDIAKVTDVVLPSWEQKLTVGHLVKVPIYSLILGSHLGSFTLDSKSGLHLVHPVLAPSVGRGKLALDRVDLKNSIAPRRYRRTDAIAVVVKTHLTASDTAGLIRNGKDLMDRKLRTHVGLPRSLPCALIGVIGLVGVYLVESARRILHSRADTVVVSEETKSRSHLNQKRKGCTRKEGIHPFNFPKKIFFLFFSFCSFLFFFVLFFFLFFRDIYYTDRA